MGEWGWKFLMVISDIFRLFFVFRSEVTCVFKSWEVVFFVCVCVCVFPGGDFGVLIFGRMFKL